MNIRAYQPSDIESAKRLFDKFYAKDANGSLRFPDFSDNYLCAFTVEDDKKEIITVGGVRTIAEICAITDKDRSVRDRVIALREALLVAKFIARDFHFDWLHAVTDDPNWASQMQQNGFVSRGVDLEIHVGDIR